MTTDGAGPFEFRVNVTDGTSADSESFTVTLGNPLAIADLNGSVDGHDFATSFTEGDSPVSIAATDASISDPTDTQLEGITATITNRADGDDEVLSFDVQGTSILGAYVNGVLALTGTDSLANYEMVLRSIQYENLSDAPTVGDRMIEVSLDDGTDFGPVSTTTLTVSAVNDAPQLTLPGDFGNPNTPVQFTLGDMITFASTVTDPDNVAGELTFMLDLDNSGITAGEALPAIDQSGNFSWQPTETGTFTVTLIVSDGLSADAETFSVEIANASAITSASTPATTANGLAVDRLMQSYGGGQREDADGGDQALVELLFA